MQSIRLEANCLQEQVQTVQNSSSEVFVMNILSTGLCHDIFKHNNDLLTTDINGKSETNML